MNMSDEVIIPTLPGYVTARVAAAKLGISRQAVVQRIKAGALKAVQVEMSPGKSLFLISDAEMEYVQAARDREILEKSPAGS